MIIITYRGSQSDSEEEISLMTDSCGITCLDQGAATLGRALSLLLLR